MNSLTNETDIVWLEDPALYPYVRVCWIPATRRRQRPPQSHLDGLQLIGYTAVAECRRHHRRVFVLEPHDLGGESPCEARAPARRTSPAARRSRPRSPPQSLPTSKALIPAVSRDSPS